MARLYTTLIALALGLTAAFAEADGAFIFTDADGNEIADGSTITVNTLEADAEWDTMDSGLFIKNTLSSVSWVEIVYEITTIDNGTHEICTQTVCNSDTKAGSYTYPSIVTMKAGATQDMYAEWYPTAYGTCIITYQLKRKQYDGKDSSGSYIYSDVADGPSVTVNYVYADPAGISSVTASKAIKSTEYYTLTGRRVATPTAGICIAKVTFADGSVKTLKVRK